MFDYQPPITAPQIIYSDAEVLIVNKPAELLSVPGRLPEHQDCLISRIQQSDPDALIVHRLDMSTSGLMVLSRNTEAQRKLSRQFERRLVKKIYLAVVSGQFELTTGTIELPLMRDWPNRPRQMVDHQQGKPARTDYRVLHYDCDTDTSRVELLPLTGRTHQLRVHMQALGHPILGDDLYADPTTLNMSERLLLHATGLEFSHTETGEKMNFTLEADF